MNYHLFCDEVSLHFLYFPMTLLEYRRYTNQPIFLIFLFGESLHLYRNIILECGFASSQVFTFDFLTPINCFQRSKKDHLSKDSWQTRSGLQSSGIVTHSQDNIHRFDHCGWAYWLWQTCPIFRI